VRRLVTGLVIAGLVAAPSCSADPSEPAATTTTTAPSSCPAAGEATDQRDVPYTSRPGVDPALVSLDLTVPGWQPGCPQVPVVVWVHGGGFSVGDKAHRIDDKRRWALDQGWAFASVNYRLSPDPPSDDPDRVQHPDHVDDVARAIAWLVGEGPARGLDPHRLALVGHSAGAFLVALTVTDPTHLRGAGVDPQRIVAAVALDTRFDVAEEIAEGGPDEAMYRNAFGTEPDGWRDASPATHAASPDIPPILVVTRGSDERMARATRFADAVRAGGAEATVVDARPLDHAGVADALGRPDDGTVTPPVTDLLRGAFA
jgi:acetyl esterase/lipase